jgi:hypothetical protein
VRADTWTSTAANRSCPLMLLFTDRDPPEQRAMVEQR